MPGEWEETPPLEKDTVRAEIHLGFHKFEDTAEGIKTTFLLQCDLQVMPQVPKSL